MNMTNNEPKQLKTLITFINHSVNAMFHSLYVE